MTTDPIWDEPFHAVAFAAFVQQARLEGGWPDPEKTKQRCYALFEAEKRREHGMATRHDEYDDDRRLREMGIDPDGDPGEIRRQVAARYRALHANDDSAKCQAPAEDAKRVVDMADLPR